ncbi:hypothetical protein HU737_012660 [Pseudomonas sp. SWRI10]|uniref:Uncharacterized protein n=1 Tax=Pseudomonas urmiensis TaxID=2745493 RepID=A0A923FZN6_9PSED|nr:hypothetical protein [Pseudomonas urmiensis]
MLQQCPHPSSLGKLKHLTELIGINLSAPMRGHRHRAENSGPSIWIG